MLSFGNVTLKHGLLLAPLAGYTDYAMRRVCRLHGAEYEVSEMVSSRALCYHDAKTPALACLRAEELPAAVQIFGNEPDYMREAAVMVASGLGGGAMPSAIDINMGCPVRKIVSAGDGSALMKDPSLVYRITEVVASAVSIPVTVKIRAGWDRAHINAVEVARAAEAGGAALITVHGRTRSELYSGKADRAVIAAVKAAVSVPVVGNGDICTAADALSMLEETGCDGVMIGRGAVGNPFLFEEIAAALEGRAFTAPTVRERLDTALLQLRLAIEDKGERDGVSEARKQFCEYLRGVRGASAMRVSINRAATYAEIEALAASFCERNIL
jgi:nifR3 family TIM-barrel protein